MNEYTFRPLDTKDLPLVGRWLESPYVVQWWGDRREQLATLELDLDEPAMRQWIVKCDGRPFAYAQAYEAHAWPQAHLEYLPTGTLMIDTFIGEADMLGSGHGPRFLQLLGNQLIAERTPAVAVDPAVGNVRARRAYAKAGFIEESVVAAEDGMVAVMLFHASWRRTLW